jgi:hypothetical protein
MPVHWSSECGANPAVARGSRHLGSAAKSRALLACSMIYLYHLFLDKQSFDPETEVSPSIVHRTALCFHLC